MMVSWCDILCRSGDHILIFFQEILQRDKTREKWQLHSIIGGGSSSTMLSAVGAISISLEHIIFSTNRLLTQSFGYVKSASKKLCIYTHQFLRECMKIQNKVNKTVTELCTTGKNSVL